MKTGIIMPSYNQGIFLEHAIQSVIANQKNFPIDIAVVDGGSTDESVEIIQRYSSFFKYWCSEQDNGQADAINKGIDILSDCDYYMWLNSDDVYENETAVKDITEFAVQNNYSVCYGKSHFIDEKGLILGEYPVEPFSKKNLGKRCFLSQPSVLFSRKAYEKVGNINENLSMCLDYEYWMRLSREYEFGYIDEYIGATRMYEGTKTAINEGTHLREAIYAISTYYGRVDMQWVLAKYKYDHRSSVINLLPDRLELILLLPFRNRLVRKTLTEK